MDGMVLCTVCGFMLLLCLAYVLHTATNCTVYFTSLLLMGIPLYEPYCIVKELELPLDYIHIKRITN